MGKAVLWCYLIWYLVVVCLYFDPAPTLWLNSLGISALIGTSLLLSVGNASRRLPEGWQVFAEVRQQLVAALPDARVDHVGSSAIPGAISKGDIDICVAVSADRFEAALQVLAELGYHEANDTLRTPQICMLKASRQDVDLALQRIEAGWRFEFFLRFRDALRAAPSLVTEYNELKTAQRVRRAVDVVIIGPS